MSKLFTPISLGKLTLPNRIVIAPMCQYSAEDGAATSWHQMHLGHLSLSGAGMLIIEATAVEPAGRISPADVGLWCDRTEQALDAVLQSVRKYSSMPLAIQLAHAGRKASTRVPWEGGQSIPSTAPRGWKTFAPSAIPFAEHDETPTALDAAGLQRIREAFTTAARRADRLGFDVIELHAAHGYLMHEFLSPLSNRREDAYGGSLENRIRFPLEIFEGIRASVPDKPVGIRVSATDWVEGGWDIEQTVVFAQELKKRGCDFIDVSSGGLSAQQKIPLGPGYQVPFAERIKRETGMPTIAVGLITEAEQAEDILASGKADMVALARGILYNPRWPWHAAAKLGAQVDAPPQYWRAVPREVKHLFTDKIPGR
ncbi:MAG TPA: NADH:flavin oxidoreductase/NADH oxidase [Noviherbaspirillum sp.]